MPTIDEVLERIEPPDGFEKFARRFKSLGDLWPHCTRADWMFMLLELYPTAHNRKLRLFTCKCARRWWHFLVDPRSQRAVIAAEKFVSGEVSKGAIEFLREGAEKAAIDAAACSKPILSRAARLAMLTLDDDCLTAAKEAVALFSAAEHAVNETNSYEHEMEILADMADFLREVLGNPFTGQSQARSAAV
jgi:hypothetical protein